MQPDLTNRFVNIFDPTKNPMSITIVGAGSIGSTLALWLARLGIKDLTVVDFDVVEDHNLGHQSYGKSDIGALKTGALYDIIREATGTEIKTIDEKITGKDLKTDILVMGVDSMAARKEIVTNAEFSFLVDGRMGGETFNIYTLNTFDKDDYLEALYDDDTASPLPCGGKSIGYISLLIGGLMENQIKKIINSEPFVPEINFCAKNMIFQT